MPFSLHTDFTFACENRLFQAVPVFAAHLLYAVILKSCSIKLSNDFQRLFYISQ